MPVAVERQVQRAETVRFVIALAECEAMGLTGGEFPRSAEAKVAADVVEQLISLVNAGELQRLAVELGIEVVAQKAGVVAREGGVEGLTAGNSLQRLARQVASRSVFIHFQPAIHHDRLGRQANDQRAVVVVARHGMAPCAGGDEEEQNEGK